MLIDRLLFLCIVVFAISIISEINLHRKRSFPMYVDKNKTRQVRTLFNNYLLKSRNFTLVLFLGSIIGSIILLFLGAKLNISKIEIFLGLSILSYIILYISSLGLYDIIKKGYLTSHLNKNSPTSKLCEGGGWIAFRNNKNLTKITKKIIIKL